MLCKVERVSVRAVPESSAPRSQNLRQQFLRMLGHGLVQAGAVGVDRDDGREVLDLKFPDGLGAAELLE